MQSYYEKLVAEKGIAAAKEYMRAIRAKRVKYPRSGMNFKRAEIRKKAEDTRGVIRDEPMA